MVKIKARIILLTTYFLPKLFYGVFFLVHCIIKKKCRNWQKKKKTCQIYLNFIHEIVWKYNTSLNITELIHVQYHDSISNTPFYCREAHHWSVAPFIFGSVGDLGRVSEIEPSHGTKSNVTITRTVFRFTNSWAKSFCFCRPWQSTQDKREEFSF